MPALDVDRLVALGFFRYCASDVERVTAVKLARERNCPFARPDHRLYSADAESLAEQGVRDFLGRVAPFLRRAGIPIDVRYRPVEVRARDGGRAELRAATLDDDGWLDEDDAPPYVESLRLAVRAGAEMCDVTEDDLGVSQTYLLFLGEREFEVYNFEPGAPWEGWTAATRSTIALVNELLDAHNSVERAYGLYRDNDLCVGFVTPEMALVVNEAAEESQRLRDGSDY